MNRSLGSIAAIFIGLAVVFFIIAGVTPHGALWGAGPPPRPASNQWAWDGGDRLEIDLPARVTLSPGGTPTVSVHGDEQDVKDIRLSHGKLTGGGDEDCFISFLCDDDRRNRPIEVELKGVTLRDIRINGVAQLQLGHLEQDSLTLHISGAGDVKGEGHVSDLNLSVSGAGNVELAGLSVANATINLSGAGRAAIAPSEEANINISGVGEVELATRPKTLHSHISGMGNLTGPGADGHSGRDIDWSGDRVRDKVEEKMKEKGFWKDPPPAPPTPPAIQHAENRTQRDFQRQVQQIVKREVAKARAQAFQQVADRLRQQNQQ